MQGHIRLDTHLIDQAASTITCYPTQPHYPDTEPTSPCPIKLSTWLGTVKSLFYKSLIWLNREPNSRSRRRETRALPFSASVNKSNLTAKAWRDLGVKPSTNAVAILHPLSAYQDWGGFPGGLPINSQLRNSWSDPISTSKFPTIVAPVINTPHHEI